MKITVFTTTTDIVKVSIIMALTVFIGSGLLYGAIKTIDATQIENSPSCEQRTVPDCPYDGQKPESGLICPNPRTPCPLDIPERKDYNNAIGGKQ